METMSMPVGHLGSGQHESMSAALRYRRVLAPASRFAEGTGLSTVGCGHRTPVTCTAGTPVAVRPQARSEMTGAFAAGSVTGPQITVNPLSKAAVLGDTPGVPTSSPPV